MFATPNIVRGSDDAKDLLGPGCGDHCKDLLGPEPPPQSTGNPEGPSTGMSVAAEWLDGLLHTKVLSKAVTVFDFESAWIRGYRECGAGCAVVDVTTKGLATLGGAALTATIGLALAEAGPLGEAYAATAGIVFADQLEHAFRNLPGFDAARQDIGGQINSWGG